ncbi:hypothetical protein OG204_29000 [Streptomyces sp. NBC_01387]|uniref:hypothetical protein n=1 Tax=unclassified Streptomyces TaxID=2593676 RepID=UPI00225B3DFE|nr:MULTISPECIES: hypothetical protein [unclassified Streptomyces]MCX4547620.1 hypothetical protein [Streptomyces sp. NBC_01500]WSC19305.1 hypothetical protein OIE60_06225 [Streptomyces sp. NBC_01766]
MATRRVFLSSASAVGAATLFSATPSAAAVPAAATVADAERQARDAMLAVNAGMRSNYAVLKSDLIAYLSPVVVVQNDAKGGKFTLVHNGTQESVNPVSEVFELAKSISHVPLGIFSTVAPYLSDKVPNLPHADRIDPHDLKMVAFKGTGTTGWIAPLQDFAATLTTARRQLDQANLPQELVTSCSELLDAAIEFINASVAGKSLDMKSFEDFSGRVYGNIRTNMKHAADAQIAGVQDVMKKWRAKIGEEGWQDLYTVVLSQWTTSVLNQNSIIIKPCMNPAKVDTHLIDLATVETPKDPIFVALDNLARIVQDNIAAEMVFPVDQEIADALKGKQDLLSDEILDQLGAVAAGARTASATTAGDACPFRKRTAAQV